MQRCEGFGFFKAAFLREGYTRPRVLMAVWPNFLFSQATLQTLAAAPGVATY